MTTHPTTTDSRTTHYRVPVAEADQIRAGLAMQMIALSVGVSTRAMTRPDRLSYSACRARWLSMYLAHVGYGWPLERVSHAFGVNRVTASAGCRWAEDARDDRALDTLLDRLEGFIRDMCEAPKLDLTPAMAAHK